MIRAGILGCGDVAGRHAAVMRALPEEIEIAALCDHTAATVQAFAQKHAPNAELFTDYRALLAEAELDLLVICLPPFAHADEVARAAANGIHILIEKPIALESEHAWRMVEAVEQAGVKSQVGFQFRFGAAVEAFTQLQHEGKTGKIVLMNARYFANHLHAAWWRDRAKSGGQVVEQAIHLFDLMAHFMGKPVTVYSRQANLLHGSVQGYTSEDTSATIVTFADGGIGVVTATNNAIPMRWIGDYRVVAERITADFATANVASFTHTDQVDIPVTRIDIERDSRREQLLDLLNAIKTGGETRTPIRAGAEVLDLVLAARRSAEEHREITLE